MHPTDNALQLIVHTKDVRLFWRASRAGGASRGGLLFVLLAELVHHRLPRVCSVGTLNLRARAHDLPMHSARDAIVQLDVELRELVVLNDAGIAQIAQARLINHVANGKPLDRLILRRLRGTSIAADLASMVAPMAIAPVVSPFDLSKYNHQYRSQERNRKRQKTRHGTSSTLRRSNHIPAQNAHGMLSSQGEDMLLNASHTVMMAAV